MLFGACASLHLLPCCEDICAILRLLRSRVWSLCRWRRSKVLVRETFLPGVVRLVVLWWGRTLRLRLGFWRRGTVVGATRSRGCVGISGWRRWSGAWGIRRVGGYVQIAVLPPLIVVLLPLRGITQNLVCSLNLLELDNKFCLVPWISIRVVLEGKCTEGLADLVLAGVGSNL